MQTLILSWMRWTGKTTIWKKIAEKIWAIFIDLDNYISKKIWYEINKYIKNEWWEKFRELETICLKEVLEKKEKKVISLWGWTIVFDRNIEEINKQKEKIIFFLETNLEIIAERIKQDEKNNKKRNSLTNKWVLEELEEIYKKREKIYKKNCDYIVSNNESIEKTLKNILKIINSKKICIPITNFDKKNLEQNFSKLKNIDEIEYIELRIDFLKKLDLLENIIKQSPKKTIVTNRIKNEWWNFNWTFEETLKIQKKALKNWAYLIDLELQVLEKIWKIDLDMSKVICSYHNFQETPKLEKLKEIIKKMDKFSPKVYKIAVKPNNEKDLEKIYNLIEYFKQNYIWKEFIFISMWEIWMPTRIIWAQKWWLLTFASFWWDSSAPGQIDYKDLYKKLID